MDDLISRQAAIDALKGLPTWWWADEGGYYGGAQPPMVALLDPEDAVSAIENLLSVQPEQRWIPVSERLPEIKQHVLLSCYGRVIYGRMISEDGNSGYPVFEICDSVGEKRPIVLETTVHSKFTTSRIIAWMPLPEAWKGEPMNDLISRQAAIDALDKHLQTTDVPVSYPGIISALTEWLNEVPSAQPQTEWNNHTVACLLAELFGDACACNYNGIDEWLPEKCEVIDACPNPVGVACWEQFLTHRAERRTDG